MNTFTSGRGGSYSYQEHPGIKQQNLHISCQNRQSFLVLNCGFLPSNSTGYHRCICPGLLFLKLEFNLRIIKFIFLQYRICWVLVYSQDCVQPSPVSNARTFLSPQKESLCLLAVTPLSSQPLETTNLFSFSDGVVRLENFVYMC